MSSILEHRISNGPVTLQVLSSVGDGFQSKAVAIVPGLAETADDWRLLIHALAPMPAAAVTLRGRGTSSRPVNGYSLADHCSDVAAFVEHLPVRHVVLVAFSRSVAYALEYAARRAPKLAGLVLLDYPSRHAALRPGWAESFAQSTWRGRRADEVISPFALQAIEFEAVAKDFEALLPSILVPTLVVRGAQPGAVLSAADAAKYQTCLPKCTLLELPASAHALWEPEPLPLFGAIAEFAESVERS